MTDPTGRLSTVTTHDARGNVIRTDQTFDGRTITTTSTYDGTDHLTSETDPLGHTSNLAWDDKGNLVTLADPEGRTWRLTYTANGFPETIVAPGGALALRLEYDTAGNLIKQDRAEGEPLTFGYTGGQLTSVTDGQGHSTTLQLNAEGRIEKITGPNSQARTFTYDASGRTLSVTEPDTGVTQFTYDAVGNMLTATDARNQVRRYTYDAAHHLLTDTDFANRTTSYTYDLAGRMVRRSDRNSQVTSYAYDAAGRLTSKTLPGSTVSYTYDPLGRPTSIVGADGRIDTSYDDASRITAQRSRGTAASPQPDVTLSFGYDTSDLETSLTSPAGSVGYRYDGRGRLSAVDRPGGGSFSFAYDALDRVTSLLHPDGVAEAMTWTDTGQLLSRTARLGSQVLASSDYTYGNGFLRTSMTNQAGANDYTYDTMGRLLSASHPASSGLAAESFTYDQTSNRTSWVGSPAASVAYTAGRLTRDGTFDYAYDAEGDLVRRTERATARATTYDWNADHLLTAIHYPDGTTSTYRYDPVGRRIEVNDAGSIRRFVWDGANVVGEYDASNTLVSSYVTTQQPGQVLAARTGAAWQSYLVDGTDSVVATVDDSGTVTSRAAYDAYGRPAGSATNTNYAFTGHQYDAKSGLYYARARYYDPAVGRFISEDPIPALNPYQYGSCNPTNLVDSSGMQVVVERSLLDRIREGIAEVALQEVGTYICHELVQAAILGFGGGPNVIGQMGEQALGDALGPNGLPQQDLGNRRPDFQLGADYFESKNAERDQRAGLRADEGHGGARHGGRWAILRAHSRLDGRKHPQGRRPPEPILRIHAGRVPDRLLAGLIDGHVRDTVSALGAAQRRVEGGPWLRRSSPSTCSPSATSERPGSLAAIGRAFDVDPCAPARTDGHPRPDPDEDRHRGGLSRRIEATSPRPALIGFQRRADSRVRRRR